MIAKGEVHPIDVGQINKQPFLEAAGVGFEAALASPGEEISRHGFLSTLRAIMTGLKILLAYKPARLRITFDEHQQRSYKAMQVTICNSPYHGFYFHAAPQPVMDDGFLDVVIYKHFSKLEYLKHAIAISQGRRVFELRALYRQVKSLRISTDQPMEIHADALPRATLPPSSGFFLVLYVSSCQAFLLLGWAPKKTRRVKCTRHLLLPRCRVNLEGRDLM